MNGAMELLLQLSGIAVLVVVTDSRQLAVKVAACFDVLLTVHLRLAACVLWLLRYRRSVDCGKRRTVVTLSDNYRKPISMSSVMFNQQMHKEFITYLLLAALLHFLIPKYLLQGVVHMLQLPAD
jgi:hypothetical protein